MHTSITTILANLGRVRSDHEVYRSELRLVDFVEPFGFQTIWGVEHHFTDNMLCLEVLQFLIYVAGRTERVKDETFVGVLTAAGMPYHEAERNVRLFAAGVLSALRKLGSTPALVRQRG